HLPGDPTGGRAVTALLLKPRVFPNDVYRVQLEVNAGRLGPDVQAVIPYNELANLNQNIGQRPQVLRLFAYLAVGLPGATHVLPMDNALLERRRDLAVLRALGAARRRVFALILLETGLLGLLGVLAGAALGHLAAWLISERIRDASSLQVILGFSAQEAPLLLL